MGAIYYIKNNFNKEIDLNDVAASVYVVPSYLSRVFNREIGESIPSYITKLRLNQAVHLLESTDLKIMEVGKEVGLVNPQYFGQLFKKTFDMSPSEYRNLKLKDKI